MSEVNRTGDLKLMQELNRYIILRTIRSDGPISRSEIAKKNGISPTTATSAVNELIRDGLVYEVGTGASNGGRKPILVRFSPDGKFIIGVTITNTAVAVAEMNLEAVVRKKRVFPIDNLSGNLVVEYVLDSIGEFLEQYDSLEKCIGISIIAPGIIDSVDGIIRYNSKLRLTNIPLKAMAEKRFKLKVWLDNDANSIAMAEKMFGKYADRNNLLYITVGDGIGAGIVVNGSVFRGFHGGAGEFGHISIVRGGIRCNCGNTGCLENYVSWPAVYSRILSSVALGRQTIMLDFAEGDITRISPALFRLALKEKDSLALEVMEETADFLATGISNLVNLFNPNVIVLGGEIVQDNDLLLSKIKELVARQAMNILTENLIIRETSLGPEFDLKGAASVLLHDFFHFSLKA